MTTKKISKGCCVVRAWSRALRITRQNNQNIRISKASFASGDINNFNDIIIMFMYQTSLLDVWILLKIYNPVPLSCSNYKGHQMTFSIIVWERWYYKLNEITSMLFYKLLYFIDKHFGYANVCMHLYTEFLCIAPRVTSTLIFKWMMHANMKQSLLLYFIKWILILIIIVLYLVYCKILTETIN